MKMHRKFFCAFALLVLVAVGFARPANVLARPHPTPTPIATPLPPEVPAVHKLAIVELVEWQSDQVDHSRFSTEFSANVTDAVVKQAADGLSKLGAFQSMVYLGTVNLKGAPPGVTSYIYHMICESGSVYERLSVDADGKIDNLLFADKLSHESDDDAND